MPETKEQVESTRHTPGPWLREKRSATDAILAGEHVTVIAEVYGRSSGHNETCIANARLIAAAPDLLEACRGARPYIYDMIKRGALPEGEDDSHFGDVQALKAINAAIDKAEGR
jgi:hypothetical protein